MQSAAALARYSEIDVHDLSGQLPIASSKIHRSRLEEVERTEIENALREARGNRVHAAKMLGIGRSTLYRGSRRSACTASTWQFENVAWFNSQLR
jgi:transcriptional regulator of acetoin/glycerol metabolism